MPPYHGRCRTTYVISREMRVSKSGGGDFTGEPETKKGPEKEQKKERRKQIESFTQDERLSKIDQQRTNAWWDLPKENYRLKEHASKHGQDFAENNEPYEKIAKNILKSPDRCFTFTEDEKRKWAYYNKEYQGLALVDENTGQLLTMYKVKEKIQDYLRKHKHYLEIE
jgi:hypothetical protein